MTDPVSFVRALKLRNEETAMLRADPSADDQGKGGIVDKKAQGFVNRGALLAYDENVPKETKDDIMDIFSLAQMAASHSYDREKETDKWYKVYTDVLMMVGFNIKEFNFLKYESQEPSFQISKAVTSFIDAIAGDNQSVKDAAKATMNSLKNADSKTVELFSSNSANPSQGNFQVGTVTADATGTVQMATVVAYFSGSQVKKNYFFFTYSNTTLKMFKSSGMYAFNTKQYARVRDEVQKKLGSSANKGIRKLPDFGGK